MSKSRPRTRRHVIDGSCKWERHLPRERYMYYISRILMSSLWPSVRGSSSIAFPPPRIEPVAHYAKAPPGRI